MVTGLVMLLFLMSNLLVLGMSTKPISLMMFWLPCETTTRLMDDGKVMQKLIELMSL